MTPTPRRLVFRNRQQTRKPDLRALRSALGLVLKDLWPDGTWELCFHLVGAEEMTQINWQYLRHKGSTDVITFDHSTMPSSFAPPGGEGARRADEGEPRKHGSPPRRQISGEAFLCVDDAVAQAGRFRITWKKELLRYAIHALLHLRGMDDHTAAGYRAMKREEERLLAATGSPARLRA